MKSCRPLMSSLARLAASFRAEYLGIYKDVGVLLFCVIMPLAYPLLYTGIYTTELVRDIPVAAVDESHAAVGREYVRRLDATEWVTVVERCPDAAAAQELIRQGRVYGYVHVPSDFAHALATGQQAHVGVYGNMSGMLYYKGLLTAATNVALDMGERIKVSRAGGTTRQQEQVAAQPVRNVTVDLFNPQGGFASFLIPGVLILILQQTLVLGMGMTGGTLAETRRRRNEPDERSLTRAVRVLLARGGAYFVHYVLMSAFVLMVVPALFRLPMLASGLELLCFVLPFLLAATGFVLTVTALLQSREMVLVIFVVCSVPLLFISGLSWPGAAVPGFWQGVSWLFPSTFGINGFVRMSVMGAGLAGVATEWCALWLQAGFYALTAIISLWWMRTHCLDE